MKCSNIVFDSLREKEIIVKEDNSLGICLSCHDGEVVVKGSQLDLIELADLLVSLALSENGNDHLHVDDLTLISNDSELKNLIIEKESKNE